MSEDDPIEAAWQGVLSSWGDEISHEKFLALALTLDRLGEAGTRYRGVKDADDGERSAVAEAQIERLLGLAMQNLDAIKTEPKTVSGKTAMFLMALGVSGSIIVTALWLLLRVL